MYVAAVKFRDGGSVYHYLSAELLQKGTFVIVESPIRAKSDFPGYEVVRVEDGDVVSTKATTWIIDKIDLSAHEARIKNAVEMAKIRRDLERKLKAAAELKRFEELASTDPEAEALVKRLKELAPAA